MVAPKKPQTKAAAEPALYDGAQVELCLRGTLLERMDG